MAKPKLTVAQRFWAKVEKTDSCWNWTAHIDERLGYGSFWIDGKHQKAHRVSYAWANGPIRNGLDVDHVCHNRSCVNPGHLRTATRKQNMENRFGAQGNSTSGIRGVFWEERAGKWRAKVHHHGKQVHVGMFLSIEDAEAAVISKRNELFTHNERDRIAA